MPPLLQLSEYDPAADYDMVAAWWRGHGQNPPPAAILPWNGIIVCEDDGQSSQPLAALWCYRDQNGVVAFAEKIVTRPGLGLKQARTTLQFALQFLQQSLARAGYQMLVIHAYQATTRYLKKWGFTESDRDMSCLWSPLNQEN